VTDDYEEIQEAIEVLASKTGCPISLRVRYGECGTLVRPPMYHKLVVSIVADRKYRLVRRMSSFLLRLALAVGNMKVMAQWEEIEEGDAPTA